MTKLVPIVLGLPPTVNLFVSMRHDLPANENRLPPVSDWTVRLWEGVVKASAVIRKRALRLERAGLRVIRD